MAKTNIISNVTGDLTIDPGASGDSYIQFDINATNEFRIGVDDDASDAFKISQGGALGTNDTFVMSAAGELRMPLTPAFMGRLLSNDLNRTGNGTTYTVGTNTAWTEIYDQGGDFNTNGTFTAPVTGKYTFEVSVLLDGFTSAHNAGYMTLNASNRDLQVNYCNPYYSAFGNAFYNYHGAFTVDMDASDTLVAQVTVSNSTLVIDVRGNAAGQYSSFSGRLSS
jgi:hypothetical protein